MSGAVPAVELRGVSVRFGGLQALAEVALSLPGTPGITAVIGPNGAGKTTLLNVLTGLVRPTAGRLLLQGRDRTGSRPDVVFRAGVSRTFQGIRLFGHLTVWQNVHLAARSALHRAGDGRVWLDRAGASATATERALCEVGLPAALWPLRPSRLTLLQQRLTEVARALTAGPVALLLDEPAAGLNTAEKAELGALLRALCLSRACRVVVVEHDMKLVMALAERIAVLNFGRKLAEGTPDAIRADPAVAEAYLGAARG